MKPKSPLLATCGLYCGACYHYRAFLSEGKHLLSEAARGGRPLVGFTCQGCHSDRLYIHPGCADCAIRACAHARDVLHCGMCPDFPCKRLKAFQNDGRAHHLDIINNLHDRVKMGDRAWLAAQVQQWQCPCGSGFSWYEDTCPNCGRPLPSY